jgi:hypothetical protein
MWYLLHLAIWLQITSASLLSPHDFIIVMELIYMGSFFILFPSPINKQFANQITNANHKNSRMGNGVLTWGNKMGNAPLSPSHNFPFTLGQILEDKGGYAYFIK